MLVSQSSAEGHVGGKDGDAVDSARGVGREMVLKTTRSVLPDAGPMYSMCTTGKDGF